MASFDHDGGTAEFHNGDRLPLHHEMKWWNERIIGLLHEHGFVKKERGGWASAKKTFQLYKGKDVVYDVETEETFGEEGKNAGDKAQEHEDSVPSGPVVHPERDTEPEELPDAKGDAVQAGLGEEPERPVRSGEE